MVYLDPTLVHLPVGLLAQLVERCTGIAVKSRMRLNFFQLLFSATRFSSVLSCEDL